MSTPVRWLRLLPICLSLAMCAAPAESRYEVRQLDAQRSRADFEVKVLWLIGVHGEFGGVHGSVRIDHFRGTARVDAWINTDDLRMRSQHYAKWAESAEFFNTLKYPQLHFVSEAIPIVRMHNGGNVDGTLTIRGVERQVHFRLEPSRCANPIEGRCAVRAKGTIQRSDFGMSAHRHTLSDHVGLWMSIFVMPVPAPPGS